MILWRKEDIMQTTIFFGFFLDFIQFQWILEFFCKKWVKSKKNPKKLWFAWYLLFIIKSWILIQFLRLYPALLEFFLYFSNLWKANFYFVCFPGKYQNFTKKPFFEEKQNFLKLKYSVSKFVCFPEKGYWSYSHQKYFSTIDITYTTFWKKNYSHTTLTFFYRSLHFGRNN